jgi:N-methylhydantoinase A
LRVGPMSAGAAPGPMCYGNGGDEPTMTDANVLLGRLPPRLLGGEVPLDVERARFGLERLGARLGLDAETLAAGVLEIGDWNQVNAIRQVTVKKGLDPRDYTMVAFGGSGPLQASRVAQLLGLGATLIPPHPGNISALGLLAVDLKSDYVSTVVQREDRFDREVVLEAFDRLEARADDALEEQGVPRERRRFLRSADLRYFGQGYETRVEVPTGALSDQALEGLVDRFHSSHQQLYGYTYRGTQKVELVNVRVTSIGTIERPPVAESPVQTERRQPVPSEMRPVYLDGRYHDCPIYRRFELAPGSTVTGPAVIEEYGSTSVIQSGHEVQVDRFGNLLLRLPA